MFPERFIQEGMLLAYGISVIFLFYRFFLYHNQKANRIAFWFLAMVWVIQTIFLLQEVIRTSSLPIGTFNDGLYTYVWIIVTFSLVVHRYFHLDLFMFFYKCLRLFGYGYSYNKIIANRRFISNSKHVKRIALCPYRFSVNSLWTIYGIVYHCPTLFYSIPFTKMEKRL